MMKNPIVHLKATLVNMLAHLLLVLQSFTLSKLYRKMEISECIDPKAIEELVSEKCTWKGINIEHVGYVGILYSEYRNWSFPQ